MRDEPQSGFLSRWSRLKTSAAKHEDKPAQSDLSALPDSAPSTSAPSTSASTPTAKASQSTAMEPPATAPTLDDVAQLTQESDYRAFVGRHVSSDVKNAAMKKLFTDPHFNVMDRMDVYIDDYSHPDPLAPAMLRQMASAKFLNLVEDDDSQKSEAVTDKTPPTATPEDKPSDPTVQTMAQSGPSSRSSIDPAHDHADLRLQPNPASGQQGTGPESA